MFHAIMPKTSLNLIIVYYLQNTTYTTRKFTKKLVILLNLC